MHMACDVEVALHQLLSFKIVPPMPIYSNSDGTPLQIHFWGGQSIETFEFWKFILITPKPQSTAVYLCI